MHILCTTGSRRYTGLLGRVEKKRKPTSAFKAGLPEPPIFEFSGSGSSSRQIPAPAITPTPTSTDHGHGYGHGHGYT